MADEKKSRPPYNYQNLVQGDPAIGKCIWARVNESTANASCRSCGAVHDCAPDAQGLVDDFTCGAASCPELNKPVPVRLLGWA